MPNSGDWLTCPRVLELLPQLEGVIEQALAMGDEETRTVAGHLVARRGKRLRPALLFLAVQFGGCRDAPLLQAAAALELLHVASLHHDDIMDRAVTRRGGASTNHLWGNAVATACGVFLFARATSLLAALGDEVNKAASIAAVQLCTGQLREVENAYNIGLTTEEHLEILALKTGTLFELPCRLAALLGAITAEHASTLVDYARDLGMAFQLADDALDLAGDAGQLGKATLTDLREGVYSFPVLHVLRQESAEAMHVRALLGQVRLDEAELGAVVKTVRECGGVDAASVLARRFAGRAAKCLDSLPEGSARDSLLALAQFSVARSS